MKHDLNAKFERLMLAFDNSSTSGIEEKNGTYTIRQLGGMSAIRNTEKLLKIFQESGFIKEVPPLNPQKIHSEGIRINNEHITLSIDHEGNDIKVTFTPGNLEDVSIDAMEGAVKSLERKARQSAIHPQRHLEPTGSGRSR